MNEAQYNNRFKRLADQIHMAPSDDAWEHIEKKLTTGQKEFAFRPLLKYAAALATILVILSVLYTYQNKNKYKPEFEGPLAITKTQSNMTINQLNEIYKKR